MDAPGRTRKRGTRINPLVAVAVILTLMAAALLLSPQGSDPKINKAGNEEYLAIPVEVEFSAPELTLVNVHGQSESLADYRDRVVIVNNWAIWCPPCKAEMPTLQAYYRAHASEGLMIIAIEAGDLDTDVLKFAESYGLQFRVWTDPHKASLRAFKNYNLPNSYVIDRTGTVRYAWVGEISAGMLEKYVTPLLAE